MVVPNCNAYIGGKYTVHCSTKSGKGFNTLCDTEQEARQFGNEQWKKPFITEIQIVKNQFYKKKRNSLLIAKATKEKTK